MSVCLSVSRSVSGCKSLTVTVTVAAVFQPLNLKSGPGAPGRRGVVTLSESVCPHSRHSPPTGVCLSESVYLSIYLSESVCLRVCLSPSRCHVTTAASAGARVPAARPPASRQEFFFLSPLINSVQIRFPEMIWVVF